MNLFEDFRTVKTAVFSGGRPAQTYNRPVNSNPRPINNRPINNRPINNRPTNTHQQYDHQHLHDNHNRRRLHDYDHRHRRIFNVDNWNNYYSGGWYNGFPYWWYWLSYYPNYYFYDNSYYYYYDQYLNNVIYTDYLPDNYSKLPIEYEGRSPIQSDYGFSNVAQFNQLNNNAIIKPTPTQTSSVQTYELGEMTKKSSKHNYVLYLVIIILIILVITKYKMK